MADLIFSKFIFSKQDQLDLEPIIPGAVHLTDTGRIYLDRPDDVGRIEITDTRIVDSETERLVIMTPVVGFYYVSETSKLFRYDGEWTCLNGDPEFIGPDGRVLPEYLPGYNRSPSDPARIGDVVFLGPGGVIPADYLGIATATQPGTVRLGSEGGSARYGKKEDVGLGNVLNVAQVAVNDIQTTPPDAGSSDRNVTSAKQMFTILGGSLSELTTSDKTLIGAINELYRLLQEK